MYVFVPSGRSHGWSVCTGAASGWSSRRSEEEEAAPPPARPRAARCLHPCSRQRRCCGSGQSGRLLSSPYSPNYEHRSAEPRTPSRPSKVKTVQQSNQLLRFNLGHTPATFLKHSVEHEYLRHKFHCSTNTHLTKFSYTYTYDWFSVSWYRHIFYKYEWRRGAQYIKRSIGKVVFIIMYNGLDFSVKLERDVSASTVFRSAVIYKWILNRFHLKSKTVINKINVYFKYLPFVSDQTVRFFCFVLFFSAHRSF